MRRGIKNLEEATEIINQLQVFSTNESIEEVSTGEIKYLLVPALLGFLTEKLRNSERLNVLNLTHVYYKDYLKRINSYGVVKIDLDDDDEEDNKSEDVVKLTTGGSLSLEDAARRRQDKINRYKKRKELEEQMKHLRTLVVNNQSSDDEIIRKYYLTMIKRWVETILEDLETIELEKQMAKRMVSEGPVRRKVPQDKLKRTDALKPFIITRSEAEKKVFGLGYPSIPLMTVDQFVDQKQKEGTWAFSNQSQTVYNNSLQKWAEDPDRKRNEDEDQEAIKESLTEKEDQEADAALRKARDWDEFKDGQYYKFSDDFIIYQRSVLFLFQM